MVKVLLAVVAVLLLWVLISAAILSPLYIP